MQEILHPRMLRRGCCLQPRPAGELEKKSLHTACPVIKGEKWSAPKWCVAGVWCCTSRRGCHLPLKGP